MNVDDVDAVAVEFRAMMRATLRDEKVGDDTLGKTFEMLQRRKTEDITDAEMRAALRHLHGEAVDLDDPHSVADEFAAMECHSYGYRRPSTRDRARGQVMAKFAANARRLANGEITHQEFEQIMGDDTGGIR